MWFSVYSIASQISSPPSHFRRQRSQPLRWICWNFRTATECAFAIEHHQWIRVFPWLYWCRSVWYKNVLTTMGCNTSWAKVGTIRFHWANYMVMVNPWGIQEKIYHSNSRETRQFHGPAPWLEFHYVKMTLRSLQNIIFRDYTSINEITLKTFSRWK